MSKSKITALLSLAFFSLFALGALAAEGTDYIMLAPIPDLVKPGTNTTNTSIFLPALFKMAIGLATALAVVMLLYGGIQYMTSDVWSKKDSAKDTIRNALVGLLLTLSSYLIVYTINPKMLNFDLQIKQLGIPENNNKSLEVGGVNGTSGNGSCIDCVKLGVPGKPPSQNGCGGSGFCQISSTMNTRLIELHGKSPLYVTESYPPTVQHQDSCHAAGTCVDATISQNSSQNVTAFINNANSSGLNAVFEVTSQARYVQLTKEGVPSSSIMVNSNANGEHFHIKLK